MMPSKRSIWKNHEVRVTKLTKVVIEKAKAGEIIKVMQLAKQHNIQVTAVLEAVSNARKALKARDIKFH